MDISNIGKAISEVSYEPQSYLCKFDDNGRRGETYPVNLTMTDDEKKKYIDAGFVEITDEEWATYTFERGANGTGMIRGKDGKPTDAPAHVPTAEEKKQAIIAQYESDKAGLQEQLLDAILHDDTESQGEIKAEMTVVDEAFDEAIKGLEV